MELHKLVNTSSAGGWYIHHTKFLNHQIPWCLEYLIRLSLSEDAAEVVDNLIKCVAAKLLLMLKRPLIIFENK